MYITLVSCISFDPYIKPQHVYTVGCGKESCISFDPYIKPQPWVGTLFSVSRCISFDPYIKPQLMAKSKGFFGVVYLLIPTSNHNLSIWGLHSGRVVYLLIPTSNHNYDDSVSSPISLYIFWFLHQTTTYRFESTDFQCIPITFSNKKWRVEYNFLCKSTKKTPIESVRW